MQLTVIGSAGDDVEEAMRVDPYPGTTITRRSAVSTVGVTPSTAYTRIGEIPCVFVYRFRFYQRPWYLDYEGRCGESVAPFHVSSSELGLPEVPLVEPDVLELTLTGAQNEDIE